MLRPKFWAAIAAALAVTMSMSLTAPTDARADRCNPDEMIAPVYTLVTGQPYEPVFGEDDGPFCYAMKTAVYPAIGCDPAYQSLQACVQSQPARTMEIVVGVCNETLDEVREAPSLPYEPPVYINDPGPLCLSIAEVVCTDPIGDGCWSPPPCGGCTRPKP